MSKKPRGFISPYRNYSFVDKDPIIDFVRTAVAKSKLTYAAIHEGSNVATSTLNDWFHGNTRRPQFATVAAVLIETGVKDIPLSALAKRGK